MLAALARDLLAPRVRSPRELTTLTGLTPLVVLPATRRSSRLAQETEAYQALAASLRVQLSDSQRIVLITSPTETEDRSGVVLGLGRALATSDVPTLLVSADLRRPGAAQAARRRAGAGLGDVLQTLERGDGESAAEVVRAVTRAHEHPSRGELRGLPSGDPAQHPAAVLSGNALGVMFDELSRSEYRYIVVEGPPLLGPIDGQLVARWVDAVLVVCRLDRLWPGDAAELGEVLARLDAPVLGSVVIGGSRVRYSLPAWTPRRAAPVGRGGGSATHRSRPDQGGDDPQVAPVQRVDERAADEQPAPRGEQRGGADAVGAAAADRVAARRGRASRRAARARTTRPGKPCSPSARA